jgi:hypothetical protein
VNTIFGSSQLEELMTKKITYIKANIFMLSLSSYGYQLPMASPNILKVTPAFSLHLWLIDLCFTLNDKIL